MSLQRHLTSPSIIIIKPFLVFPVTCLSEHWKTCRWADATDHRPIVVSSTLRMRRYQETVGFTPAIECQIRLRWQEIQIIAASDLWTGEGESSGTKQRETIAPSRRAIWSAATERCLITVPYNSFSIRAIHTRTVTVIIQRYRLVCGGVSINVWLICVWVFIFRDSHYASSCVGFVCALFCVCACVWLTLVVLSGTTAEVGKRAELASHGDFGSFGAGRSAVEQNRRAGECSTGEEGLVEATRRVIAKSEYRSKKLSWQ